MKRRHKVAVTRVNNHWVLRFRQPVAGSGRPVHRSVKVAPVEGPGRTPPPHVLALAREVRDREVGSPTHPLAAGIRLGDFIQGTYLPEKRAEVKLNSYDLYVKRSRYLQGSALASMWIGSVKTSDIMSFLRETITAHNLGADSASGLKSFLRDCFRCAAQHDLIRPGSSPVQDARIPHGLHRGAKRRYEIEDYITILRFSEPLDAAFMACTASGIGKAEARALEWSNIGRPDDSGLRKISIEASSWRQHRWATKTEARKNTVLMPEVLAGYLDEWHALLGNPASGLVFPGPHGRLISEDQIGRRVMKVLEANGRVWKGFHCGRHMLGSTLVEKLKLPITVAAMALRHANPAVTAKHYLVGVDPELAKGMKAYGDLLDAQLNDCSQNVRKGSVN